MPLQSFLAPFCHVISLFLVYHQLLHNAIYSLRALFRSLPMLCVNANLTPSAIQFAASLQALMSRSFSQNVSLSNHCENNKPLKSIPQLNTFRVTADSHITVFAYSLWSSPLIFFKNFRNISVTQPVRALPAIIVFLLFLMSLVFWFLAVFNQLERQLFL